MANWTTISLVASSNSGSKKTPRSSRNWSINRRVLVFFSRKIQGRSIKAPYSSRFPLRLWYWFPATKTFRIFFTGLAATSGLASKGVLTTPKSILPSYRDWMVSGVGALDTMTLILGYRP